MRWALDLEIKAKGYHPEFDVLVPALFDKVIPHLLRPLESDGRCVKPSLVYGDLWYTNSGIDVETDESLIFDACCFYAHNECKSHNHQRLVESISGLTCACLMKMSSVNGGQFETDSELNIWLHITPMFKFLHLKRITMVVLISTRCENTPLGICRCEHYLTQV
jgi:hypothetical protein